MGIKLKGYNGMYVALNLSSGSTGITFYGKIDYDVKKGRVLLNEAKRVNFTNDALDGSDLEAYCICLATKGYLPPFEISNDKITIIKNVTEDVNEKMQGIESKIDPFKKPTGK